MNTKTFLVTITSGDDTRWLQPDEHVARQLAFVGKSICESVTLGSVPMVTAEVHQPQQELALK